jgi:hypothetical protein
MKLLRLSVSVLKYVPLALVVLLVGLWVLNSFVNVSLNIPLSGDWYCGVSVYRGSVGVVCHQFNYFHWLEVGNGFALGEFRYINVCVQTWPRYVRYAELMIPISCFITLLLPLAIGPFIRYRFRLWMWLAYTALIAAECAYYAAALATTEHGTQPQSLDHSSEAYAANSQG